MKIVILTGDEIRHHYFRLKVSNDRRIQVLASYCEGDEKSLANRVNSNIDSTFMEKLHVTARTQSEQDFFGDSINLLEDKSNPIKLVKGKINEELIVDEIERLGADLLVCYGSSLIKSSLLKSYKNKFLNVHLGLSPYYRGSGSNVWPLINCEPDMVGATFMFIDEGIDTGKIIHQIRADIFIGDSPHSIGNRLIKKMTSTYCDIISSFYNLTDEIQPNSDGKLYFVKDFNSEVCATLYHNFNKELIYQYILNKSESSLPYIVTNKGLKYTYQQKLENI
jgi:phosphoribosylglycinamide formyltransferase-1